MHRLHKNARGPWWFSNDGSGRFDLLGPDGGTCYLAELELGAWVETFRKSMLVPEAEVEARSLHSVVLGRRLVLANLTSRGALKFGVSASLGTDPEYAASQKLAGELAAVGFDGVLYWVRHDPAQQLRGVALFGPIGAPALGDLRWPVANDRDIPDDLVAKAEAAFGYKVLPTP